MREEETSAKRPSVIPRHNIPISSLPDDPDLEVRAFDDHAILSEVVPRSDVGMSWINARPGQDVPMRLHPTRSILVVLDGSAQLVGPLQRRVQQGDVVTVPPEQTYGFCEVGSEGLHVLHVAFADDEASPARANDSFSELLARNDARMRGAFENPFYLLFQSGQLKDPKRREVMGEALRVFSDAFQTILFTRQATCRDPRFMQVFHEHFAEELGHNELLKVGAPSRVGKDPVLRASSVWFCHQMLLLDNAGKAVINLVLETAGYHFHSLASSVLVGDESEQYFQVHAEDDAAHMQIGLDLLKDLHPHNHRRLQAVLEDAWDMFEVMASRIAHLVDAESD